MLFFYWYQPEKKTLRFAAHNFNTVGASKATFAFSQERRSCPSKRFWRMARRRYQISGENTVRSSQKLQVKPRKMHVNSELISKPKSHNSYLLLHLYMQITMCSCASICLQPWPSMCPVLSRSQIHREGGKNSFICIFAVGSSADFSTE